VYQLCDDALEFASSLQNKGKLMDIGMWSL
jgi:hypothetical protein